MKTIALAALLLIPLNLQGQTFFQDDTILIREVLISGKMPDLSPAGFKTVSLDSSFISRYNHTSIADLISENSTVIIKSYGSGGLATASFRGTGPGHTQLTWNGINLNNPMLGQFDMSLIPAGIADNVQIAYGGGSMDINSGGIGGIVNIETKPEWRKGNTLLFNPYYGSFGRFSGTASLRTGNSTFQSVTKAFIRKAENDFPYLNSLRGPKPVLEKRENSQLSQDAFIQELYLRNSDNVLSARVWYQSTSRNLPVPLSMLSENPREKQEDLSFRALVNYELTKASADYSISAAFTSDRLIYTNKLASINSRNFVNNFTFKADLQTLIKRLTRFKIGFDNGMSFVNSNNYSDNITRNISSVGASAETKIFHRLATHILLREILLDNEFLPPVFSAGAELKIFEDRDFFVKAGFSKNLRIPSLNDMYWYPGGNPDLKNENGYTTEIGWEMAEPLSSSLNLGGEITAFRNLINNMIQWLPGEFSYWEPRNVNKIVTSGIESEINVSYTLQDFKAIMKVLYAYTSAMNAASEKDDNRSERLQLIYIPRNHFNLILKLNWKNLFSTVNSSYTGRRFITADNSSYLPAYMITDLDIGTKISLKNTSCFFSLVIENLFNNSYQSIAWYPMPGRAYSFSFVLELNKQQ